MTQSMTGYNKLSFSYAEKTIHIEIKTLNSKHLDISTRIPSIYKTKELVIRELIHRNLVRGKIEFNIFVDMGGASQAAKINQELFVEYYNQLKGLSTNANIPMDSDVFSIITRFPDIMKQEREEIEDEEWNAILGKTEEALEMVTQYRKDEGLSLEKDVLGSTQRINKLIDDIIPFEEARITNVRARLMASLEKLIDKSKIDEGRFEQELTFYLEKLDINEEKVRLRNHCEYFIENLKSDIPSGKKLGFIAQEMGREINTLGSKANDLEIQKIVVEMKDELEKIKEQILNIL